MALILFLLSEKNSPELRELGTENASLNCENPHCISRTERGIVKLFRGEKCAYCDQSAKKI